MVVKDMQIQFIRHCETEWNRLEKCQGVSDIELNDNGIYDAKIIQYKNALKQIRSK